MLPLLCPAEVSGVVARCRKPPGLMYGTSSFGSCGSRGGGAVVSAVGMSSRPKPVNGSKPGVETSCADARMISNTCEASSVGRAVQTQSAAAATIGDAKLVPSNWSYLSGG